MYLICFSSLPSANPAVCAVDNQKAVVIGQSVELEVYVSGIPPIISSWITWFGPDGNALTESNAAFRNNRRKLVLDNVQNSSSGVYKCQVDIPDSSTASDAIKLEVYRKSTPGRNIVLLWLVGLQFLRNCI